MARFEGIARDAKLAAALLTDDGGVIYLLDRASWPDDLHGARVVVEGELEQTDDFTAHVGPDGAISQGTSGGDSVIRRSTIRRA